MFLSNHKKKNGTFISQPKPNPEVKNSKKSKIKLFFNHLKENLPDKLIDVALTKVIPTILSSGANALVNKSNPMNSVINIESRKNTETCNNQKQIVKSPPKPNMVSPHKQSYNTKNGKIIKDIAPYYRGGKNDDSSL